MKDTDQWLSDGECGKCRRANYCQNECAARKKFLQRRAASHALAMSAEIYCKMMRARRDEKNQINTTGMHDN